jgi:4-hydroxybenzoate polyprenyltransferase
MDTASQSQSHKLGKYSVQGACTDDIVADYKDVMFTKKDGTKYTLKVCYTVNTYTYISLYMLTCSICAITNTTFKVTHTLSHTAALCSHWRFTFMHAHIVHVFITHTHSCYSLDQNDSH